MSYISHQIQRIRVPSSPLSGDTITLSSSYQAFATTVSLPQSALLANRSFRFDLRGIINVGVSLTLQVQFLLNSTAIATSPAIAMLALSNAAWKASLFFDVISVGTSGQIEAQGDALFGMSGVGDVSAGLPNTAPITINTTTDQVLSMAIKGSAIGLGTNTLQLRKLLAEATMIQ